MNALPWEDRNTTSRIVELLIEHAYTHAHADAHDETVARRLSNALRDAARTATHRVPIVPPSRAMRATAAQLRDYQVRAWADILEAHYTTIAVERLAALIRMVHGIQTVSDRDMPAVLNRIDLGDQAAYWHRTIHTLAALRLTRQDDPMWLMLHRQYDDLTQTIATEAGAELGLVEFDAANLTLVCLCAWFPQEACDMFQDMIR